MVTDMNYYLEIIFLREAIIPSPRGTIYDRNGVKISYSRPMVNLYAKNIVKRKRLDLSKI